VDVGDHPDPDQVGDLAHRVDLAMALVEQAAGLAGEGLDRLGPSGHAQIVDARVIDDRGHVRDHLPSGPLQSGPQLGILRDGAIDLAGTHGGILSGSVVENRLWHH